MHVAWQQGKPPLFPHLYLLRTSCPSPSTLRSALHSPPPFHPVSTGCSYIRASHNTNMSQPILTEILITSNIVTNLDNFVMTATIEDPSSAEVANPPLVPRRMFCPLSFHAPPTPVPIPVPPMSPVSTSTDRTEYG